MSFRVVMNGHKLLREQSPLASPISYHSRAHNSDFGIVHSTHKANTTVSLRTWPLCRQSAIPTPRLNAQYPSRAIPITRNTKLSEGISPVCQICLECFADLVSSSFGVVSCPTDGVQWPFRYRLLLLRECIHQILYRFLRVESFLCQPCLEQKATNTHRVNRHILHSAAQQNFALRKAAGLPRDGRPS